MARRRARAGGEWVGGAWFKGGQFVPDVLYEIDPDLKRLGKAFGGQKKRIEKEIKGLAKRIYKRLQKNTPRRTGRLVRSQKLTKAGDLTWEMSENVSPPYGLYISKGVPAEKINPILPREKKALYWPGLPHPVKAVYKHPGIKANPYVPRTIDDSLDDIQETADRIGGDIIVQIIDA